ncbi:MAG: putative carbon monoxide dehydrogenase large subunit [Actinomycetia bacterium]|nr:putative carbon monoxide dehydrogenase large subunit [Actinomycetes bacterium]
MSTPGSILGTRVVRTEDPELVTGRGRYVADLPLEGKVFAVFVRSDVAHGVLRAVHTEDAVGLPGVVAVWTAADLGVAPHHGSFKVHDDFARPPLATDRVRFAGDMVAVVFAETMAQGEDAAALVWADIDPLPVLVDPEAALAGGAEVIFPVHGDNSALAITDKNVVDLEAVSDVVVRGRYVNQRMAVAPMEVNCCAAAPAADGRITVYPSTQMPHGLHDSLAEVLGWDKSQLHIITPRVGGGFGGKAGICPEYTVVVKAAKDLDRPVVWVPPRSDDMKSLSHSRGQIQYAELGLKHDGTFTGLRVRLVGDAGGYPGIGTFLPGGTRRMSHGTYDFPAIQFDVAVAVTNTTPMGAYRGAGRPEATALLERLVDQAAIETGIDPIELRIQNFLGDDVFPFRTLTGNVYDSGRYALPLRTAAEVVGYEHLRAEQAARRERGDRKLLGLGVSAYVEITAGGGAEEYGAVEVHDDGSATVFAGTSAHGQGHQTAFAMLVSDQTGIPIERITLVDGDTDRVPRGAGTGGSRSLQVGGSAVHKATEILVERAKEVAAQELEASVDDIVVDVAAGTVGVAGVPVSAMTWAELAAKERLHGEFVFDQQGATFPFGAHIAVVEVDVETGRTTLLHHVAVDDCGTVLNPLLVQGQQHGGVAAGVGQALFEEVRYDVDGNPLTSNFADYCIPSAADLPSFDVRSTETASPMNPLGAKGIGEASTIGATPAVQNAVIDAVAHLGIRHLDLPCTPERVWLAIRDAQAGSPPDPWREPPAVFGAAGPVDEAGIAAAEGI